MYPQITIILNDKIRFQLFYKAYIILYKVYNIYNVNIYIYNECTNPTQILQIGHAAFIIFSFMCGQKDYKEGK